VVIDEQLSMLTVLVKFSYIRCLFSIFQLPEHAYSEFVVAVVGVNITIWLGVSHALCEAHICYDAALPS